ncbi:MAG: chemotaxis protein CheW [Leptospiraceae bacterium]|nr:chemotaxis protein CheW [Leptospiraceae bacterium]MDW8306940.1 chemotaxis protein CheW [Leptospiraceae bacterium]
MSNRKDEQFLAFRLGEYLYALPISVVLEIIPSQEITPLPLAPNYLLGIVNLRGIALPILDLAAIFSKKTSTTSKTPAIIVCEVNPFSLGFYVDQVLEVFACSQQEIQKLPQLEQKTQKSHIQGTVLRDEKFVVILNADQILDMEELRKLSHFLSNSAEKNADLHS